jgi:hypothetical protein
VDNDRVIEPTVPPRAPLGIGDIIERAIAAYRRDPGTLIAIAAVPAVAVLAVALAADRAVADGLALRTLSELAASAGSGDPQAMLALRPEQLTALATVGAIVSLVALVVLPIQTAALLDATARLHRGEPATIAGALATGVRAAPRLIGAESVAILAVILVGGAGVVAGVGVAAALGNPIPAIAVGIALLVALVYVVAGWTLVPAAVTLEGSGPIRALGRSWRLADHARWRILGLLLFVGVVQAIVGGILGAIAGPLGPAVRQVLDLGLGVLWAPLQSAVIAILFLDLGGRAAPPAA